MLPLKHAAARVAMDQSGFVIFMEEAGVSPDVRHDKQDMIQRRQNDTLPRKGQPKMDRV